MTTSSIASRVDADITVTDLTDTDSDSEESDSEIFDDEPVLTALSWSARSMRNVGSSPFRAPHLAELIANDLRHKILTGELADGAHLPRQEDLLAAYGVSKPSLREALRILESQGLVSVLRGKVGGAVVHRPDVQTVAYSVGLVLQSQGVLVHDLSDALNRIEPQCVALCTARADRHEAVLPKLRAVQDEAARQIHDVSAFTVVSRRFHEEIVANCGNQSLILVVGALEAVWSAHAREWAEHNVAGDGFPNLDYRRQGLEDHGRLLELIAAGDPAAAAAEAARHLEWAPVYAIDFDHGVLPSLLSFGDHSRER